MSDKNNKLISVFDLAICPQDSLQYSNPVAKDLNDFRDHQDENKKSHHHLPFSARKKSVSAYRLIFFCFGALFSLLSLLIHFKTQANFTHVIFGSFSTFKTIVLTICGFLSLSSFFIGFSLNTEKEAAKHFINKAKNHLLRVYSRKKIQFGITEIISVGINRKRALTLKQLYKEALNKIEEYYDETLVLFDQISESEALDFGKKEDLMNQAIVELKSKLDHILHLFRNTDASKLT